MPIFTPSQQEDITQIKNILTDLDNETIGERCGKAELVFSSGLNAPTNMQKMLRFSLFPTQVYRFAKTIFRNGLTSPDSKERLFTAIANANGHENLKSLKYTLCAYVTGYSATDDESAAALVETVKNILNELLHSDLEMGTRNSGPN